jgi:hypothetical protein
MKPKEIKEFRRAFALGEITQAVQQIWSTWMRFGGASADGLSVSQILFRRHAKRSGPKTNFVQRQGAARNDHEDDPTLTVEELMELHDLTLPQVNAAIAKTNVSSAILRAADEDRLLRPILGRLAQNDLASDSTNASSKHVLTVELATDGDDP